MNTLMPIKDSDEILFRLHIRDEVTEARFDFEKKVKIKDFRATKYVRVGDYPWATFKYHTHDKDFMMVELISMYYNYNKKFVRRKYTINLDNVVVTEKYYISKRRCAFCAFTYVRKGFPVSTEPFVNSVFPDDDEDYKY